MCSRILRFQKEPLSTLPLPLPRSCMEHDVASGQMYAYTEIPTTSPPGYRRERLIIPLGLWGFPVDEKPIFPFFVDWALQGGASKPRPSNFLSTGIVDWAGWYLVLSTGLAGLAGLSTVLHLGEGN